MKELQWDDSVEGSKDYITAARLSVNESDENPVKTVMPKTHLTDLRRRIEERLDGKRIDHEFEYDDLDGLLDNMS